MIEGITLEKELRRMGQHQIWRDCGTLVIMCIVLLFFGSGSIPITDPTESNYVLTAKEMVTSGEYMSPRIYGVDWYDKPIMFYWELIAAFKLFGISDGAARFFPALMATVSVLGTYFFGSWLYDRRYGLTAGIILLTSLEFWYIGHAVITDMTLFCSMSAALCFFYAGYTKKKPKLYYFAYAAAGIAVLTKGPIGLAMPGLIILLFLAWQRDFSRLLKMRIGTGMLLFTAIISVWYLPMFVMHGWDFINTFFGVHNVLRATVSEHPEVNYWFYYLLVFIAGFLPWVVPVLIHGAKQLWSRRNDLKLSAVSFDERKRFLLVWALAVPAVFQCFETKYVTYTFPYMMPMALLFAGYFVKRELMFRRMAAGCLVVMPLLLFFVAVPLCEQSSAKQESEEIMRLADSDTCIAQYRKRYSASMTFYTGKEVFRLETPAERDRLKPNGIAWNSLNVMPFMTFDEMPKARDMLVVVEKKRYELFSAQAEGSWELAAELPDSRIYVRKASNVK